MGLNDIFTTKKPVDTTTSIIQQENSDDQIAVISGASYTAKGTRDAGLCMGSAHALLPKLQAVFMQLSRYIQQDEMKQNERKNKIRQEICNLDTNKKNFENQINEEQEKLDREEKKIEKIIIDIDNIKVRPEIVTGDSFAKASFWIGFVIIVLLTIYLFVFYSSASFSAFFKNFSSNDTNVAQAIFDAQAINKAWADGFTELIFILAIPAVFLGLGFLIHKFSEAKGISKYFKISGLIFVTFIFDFIIAYEIVEKIYNIKKEGSFETLPDMTIAMSTQQVNFWLIIFAGFVVYIIWGLVFNFTMIEYKKMDKVQYAIKNKEKRLSEFQIECNQIRGKISNLQNQKINTQGQIDILKIQLESYVLYFNDVREGLNNYFSGWIGYLKATAASQSLIEECKSIKDRFLLELQNSEFIKN